MIANFKKLNIWIRSRAYVKSIYNVAQEFPSEEKFGLTSQIKRAAVSVPSNIAEGSGRRTKADFSRFLDISIGSLCEIETQLYVAFDLNFIKEDQLNELVKENTEIRKMIIGFQNKL